MVSRVVDQRRERPRELFGVARQRRASGIEEQFRSGIERRALFVEKLKGLLKCRTGVGRGHITVAPGLGDGVRCRLQTVDFLLGVLKLLIRAAARRKPGCDEHRREDGRRGASLHDVELSKIRARSGPTAVRGSDGDLSMAVSFIGSAVHRRTTEHDWGSGYRVPSTSVDGVGVGTISTEVNPASDSHCR